MRTIEIPVKDQDVSKLMSFLTKLDFVKLVKEKKSLEVDPATRLSEQSLAEEWDSNEDSRYEKYFEK